MKTVLTLLLAAAALSGCAALNSVTSDVSSFGEWPTARKPGTYAFERLPSQQALAAETGALEAAARPALQKAGFTAVEAGKEPDVLVQVGSRVGRTEPTWAAPIWWGGNFGYYRHGPWIGPRWGLNFQYDALRYDREVAVLIRDRSSGKPIFEARASNEGSVSSASSTTLTAMFEAAMLDFPRLGMNPRRVSVPLTAP